MAKMNWNRVHREDLARRVRDADPRDRGEVPPLDYADAPPPKQCVALKANGQRCRGSAKHGEIFCGPHCDHPPQRIHGH